MTTGRLAVVGDHPQALESLGFFLITRYFADDQDQVCFGRDRAGRRADNLHVFHPRSPEPQSNRNFRDYLIAHPADAHRYAQAKLAAAAASPNSRAGYSDHKAETVAALRRPVDVWALRSRASAANSP